MKKYHEAQLWLERAKDTLFASDFNLKNELTISAINRAYYSMYYCTIAILRTENIIAKSHSGTINKFSEIFIKTNRISSHYSYLLGKAFDFRHSCDYDIEVNVSEIEAKQIVDDAKEFFEFTESYLQMLFKDKP